MNEPRIIPEVVCVQKRYLIPKIETSDASVHFVQTVVRYITSRKNKMDSHTFFEVINDDMDGDARKSEIYDRSYLMLLMAAGNLLLISYLQVVAVTPAINMFALESRIRRIVLL